MSRLSLVLENLFDAIICSTKVISCFLIKSINDSDYYLQCVYNVVFRCAFILQFANVYFLVCFYCIGLSRYIAITNLPILAVFGEYLRQFVIDLNQISRHSSVPKTRLPEFFELFSSSGFRARHRRDFFCHVVSVTV